MPKYRESFLSVRGVNREEISGESLCALKRVDLFVRD